MIKTIFDLQLNLSLQKPIYVLADTGYHSGVEIKKCIENNIITYVSPEQPNVFNKNKKFHHSRFEYNSQHDFYTCPNGSRLYCKTNAYTRKGKGNRKPYKVKAYLTKDCKNCPLRNKCTSDKRGRRIERNEYRDYVDANDKRVKNNPDYYKRRKTHIEHQFGTLKRHWGYTYTNRRGKDNVLAEVHLYCTVYNLKRCVNILGFECLMDYMRRAGHFYILYELL